MKDDLLLCASLHNGSMDIAFMNIFLINVKNSNINNSLSQLHFSWTMTKCIDKSVQPNLP